MSADGDIVIRRYRPGDEVASRELFQTVFGSEKTAEHWNWEFRSRPLGIYVMLGYYKDRLAAQCAGIPLMTHCKDRTVMLLQGVDFMSRPQLRSHWVFMKTAEAYFREFGGTGEDQTPLVFGFPGTRHRILGEKRLSYTTLTAVRCMEKKSGSGEARPAWAVSARYRVRRVRAFDRGADGLWERNKRAYPMALVRDREYLNWRYASHPTIRYDLLQAEDRIRGRVEAWAVVDAAKGFLVDFFPCLGHAGPNDLLLWEAERTLAQRNASRLETWCHPRSPAYTRLLEAGFQVIPQRDNLHLGAISFSRDMDLGWVAEHFCYTLGDTDIA